MPYEISLDRDPDTGLDRYTVVVAGELSQAESRELSDWLTAAAQNPTASFAVDLSDAGEVANDLRAALSVVGAEDLAGLGYTQS
jgi:hypothetical protein